MRMITYNCNAVIESIDLSYFDADIESETESDVVLDAKAIYFSYVRILPVLIFFGLLGNLINVIVFSHHRMRMPSGFHLTLLTIAVADSGVLVCAILDVVQRSKDINIDEHSFTNKLSDFIKYPLQNFFKHGSIWLLILSAFIRFIGVRYPFQAVCWFNKRRTMIGILLTLLFCALCNVPRVFETELLVCPMEEEDIYYTVMKETELGRSATYKSVFPLFASCVFFIIPFAMLSVFNTILLIDIWRHRRIRHSLSKTNTKIQVNERQITTMIAVVITLFLILESPIAVLDVLYELSVPVSTEDQRKGILDIANLISIVNCTVNFVIYVTFSKQYRQTLVAVFKCNGCCPCCCSKRTTTMSISNPIISRTSRLSLEEPANRNSRLKLPLGSQNMQRNLTES